MFARDKTCNAGKVCKELFDSYSYDQLISEPTRFSGNSQSCIDLLFTNTTHFFNKIGTEPPLPNCDHVPITAVFKYKHDSSFKREVWNFKKADFDKFRCLLSTSPWQNVTLLDDVNECVSMWSDMFIKIAEACVPHQNVIIRPKDKPWMNSEIRKCINNRRKLFHKFKRSSLDSVKNDYKQLRNKIVSMAKEAKNAYEVKTESILCNTATKPKQWWSVLKREIKGSKKSEIPSIVHGTDNIHDNSKKAEGVNNYFIQQSTVDDNDMILPPLADHDYPDIEDLLITSDQVKNILSTLDCSKWTGCDQIGNRLLKKAAIPISQILCHIFNKSLTNGIYPETWKRALVIPLYKKGIKSDINNYRPVSLLPCVSKVFEKLIFQHIFSYLRHNAILSPHQSGFINGDSCVN